MATTSIRIDRKAHERLKKVAEKEESSLSGVINELLDRYDREEFRKQVAADFTRLRSNPEEWADYQRELREWDAVLSDGLENDRPYSDEDVPDGQ